MSEEIYVITNPLKFFTKEYLQDKLIQYGFPEEILEIKLIKEKQMTIQIVLFFIFPEMGEKFYTKFNNKSIGFAPNYRIKIKKGKSSIKKDNSKEKEIIYNDNYESWIDRYYMLKNKEDGLILVNPNQKEIQKIMLQFLIQKINSPYIKGNNIINFLFPITAYDKRTLLQVYAYELREAPFILYKILYTSDPVEKLKFMTSFFISQIYLSPLRIKPFNPLLGETYQVKIGNLDCYFEQTNTNPPTTNIYCIDSDGLYKIYGYISIYTKTGINNCKVFKIGNIYVHYKDGQKYKIYFPSYYVGGITIGKRCFNVKDVSLVIDETNRLVSFIKFYDKKKNYNYIDVKYPDEFEGKLISIKEIKIDNKGAKHSIIEELSIPLAEFSGTWTRELVFGNKIYWKRDKKSLCKLYEPDFKLKSDSSLRDDLKLYNENKIKEAEEKLLEMDKQQNSDMKLRYNHSHELKILFI